VDQLQDDYGDAKRFGLVERPAFVLWVRVASGWRAEGSSDHHDVLAARVADRFRGFETTIVRMGELPT